MGSYAIETVLVAETKKRLAELFDRFDQDVSLVSSVRSAVTIYGQHRLRLTANDVTGDGGFDYPINSSNFPDYVPGFSSIHRVEFPLTTSVAEPNYLEDDEWIIYEDGTNENLRFLSATPSASQQFRAHYNIPRLIDASGDADIVSGITAVVIDTDFYALCDLGASKFLEAVAAKFIATGDSTLQVDTVNYRSKSSEAMRLAEAFYKRYAKAIGVTEESGVRGASVDKDWDTEYPFAVDHLTHPKRWY